MKVLVALHDYLPRHPGGSEIHAHEVAAELARRGHAVTAAFTERDLDAPEGELRRGALDGVRTIELVHQREYADVRETWEEAGALERFRAILAEVRPDVVHFHHLAFWGSGAVAAARAAGARTVLTLHDYHLVCDAATLLRRDLSICDAPPGTCTDCLRRHPVLAERWDGLDRDAAYARAARERLERHRADLAAVDVAIAPSAFLAGVFQRARMLAPERIEVLRAGYPGPRRAPRVSDPARPLAVGYVGGIYPAKGLHVLIDAFRRLAGVPATLAIRGHLAWFPDYVARLRADAEGLAVTFGGAYAREELDAVLAPLDVLVVPSIWYENMPLTIQEAYRNGLPVVATDLGGMRESVEDGVSGLLFPRGDSAALAERLARLARDRALLARLAAGRPRVATLEEVVDRLEHLYRGA